MAESKIEGADYPYQRLKDASQIRVLDLQPGSWKDEIHCLLRTLTRESAKYEALSYVWGPSNQGRTLFLDEEHRVSITDNLFLALRRLRKKWTARTLWVDAVCINQFDSEDKGEQVASMADTYRDAKIVNVWLGESPSARSIHLKCAFAPMILTTGLMYSLRRLGQGFNSLASDVTWICQHLGSPRQTKDVVDGVEPWCSRAWTVQEFCLAQRVRICLGGAEVLWAPSNLDRYEYLVKGRREALALRLSFSKKDLGSVRRRVEILVPDPTSLTLTDALDVLSGTSATDPRDMVYSILGILKQEIQQFIRPDYTLTYAEVCATATAAALRASTIEILMHVKFDRDKDASWPSWAVDFAERHRGEDNELRSCLNRQIFIASFESATLGILGRTLGTAVECKAILPGDVTATYARYIRTSYEHPEFDPLSVAQYFVLYTDNAFEARNLVKLSNGIEVLGPDVVRAGDQLVRLCYMDPFSLPRPEVFVWLRPNGDTFLFRGLGLVLGDTVYTHDYESYGHEHMDDRTEAEKRAGFETFLVR